MVIKKISFLAIFSLLFFQQLDLGAASLSVGRSLFEKGRTRFSASVGAGRAFNEDYAVLGIGAGYYIANGLEFGLNAEGWWGNNPNIYTLSPQLNYVFYRMERLNPYVGTFYKRTFYEGFSDLDSYGGRVGVFSQMSSNVSLGFGYVFEKYVGCDDAIYSSCSTNYPEVSISAGF